MYLITSFVFFLLAGIMALLIRIQLLSPTSTFLSDQVYNELFTMHGTIMLLLFATPLFVGFANELVPLQMGSPDVAFPRLNLLSYYLFAFGGLILFASFLAPGGAAAFGWYAYSPLTSATNSPGVGADMWIMGLALSGFGTILGGVNFVTTIFCMRAPGMTMFRMPIFTWNALLTSILVLLAFPVLAAALLVLEVDRRLVAQVFAANSGGAILWQNLFWFFGHPEVYILALPFFGIATEILPVFSRKPLFGYKTLIAATIAISRPVDDGVGAPHVHHRRGAAAVLLIHDAADRDTHRREVLQLAGTMWKGQISFEPPMLFADRLPGRVPLRRHRRHHPWPHRRWTSRSPTPTSWWRTSTTCSRARCCWRCSPGFYFWWPKMTGKMLSNKMGKVHFWLLFIGFNMTFLVQHWAGVEGQVRRTANYPFLPGNVTTLNIISTVGSWIIALSVLLFIWNIQSPCDSARRSPRKTRGATAPRLSGPPPARRRGTTAAGSRGSGPSAPRRPALPAHQVRARRRRASNRTSPRSALAKK